MNWISRCRSRVQQFRRDSRNMMEFHSRNRMSFGSHGNSSAFFPPSLFLTPLLLPRSLGFSALNFQSSSVGIPGTKRSIWRSSLLAHVTIGWTIWSFLSLSFVSVFSWWFYSPINFWCEVTACSWSWNIGGATDFNSRLIVGRCKILRIILM